MFFRRYFIHEYIMSLSCNQFSILLLQVTVDSIDDKEDMQFADEAFDILGFTKVEKYDVFKVLNFYCYKSINTKIPIQYFLQIFSLLYCQSTAYLIVQVTAVVMHLGEIKFKKKSGKDDQAQPDGTEAGANVAKLLGKNSMLSFLRHFYQFKKLETSLEKCIC